MSAKGLPAKLNNKNDGRKDDNSSLSANLLFSTCSAAWNALEVAQQSTSSISLTMSPAATYPEHSNAVKSNLNYWLDPALGGHTSYYTGTAGYYRRKFDEHVVEINDARGHEDDFNLNTHGFQYHKHSSAERDFVDDERVKAIVYPETEKLIKEM